MSSKIIGYLLLVFGLVIIILASLSVFSVFTKKSRPFDLFNLTGVSFDLTQMADQPLTAEEKEKLADSSQVELLSRDKINEPLNIAAHLLLMGFLVNVGFKVASLGVMLIRPIKVQTVGKLANNDSAGKPNSLLPPKST